MSAIPINRACKALLHGLPPGACWRADHVTVVHAIIAGNLNSASLPHNQLLNRFFCSFICANRLLPLMPIITLCTEIHHDQPPRNIDGH